MGLMIGSQGMAQESPKSLMQWQVGNSLWESPANEYDRMVTDRPHVSEATATVGRGRAQLETGYSYFHDSDGSVKTDRHSYPEPLLRIGMFADWFELRLGTNYRNEYERTAGVVTAKHTGADDMYIASKVAIAKQQGILPDLTIFPQMRVPTGASSFSSHRVSPGVNIAYSWVLTKRIELECNTVFNRFTDEFDRQFTQQLQTINFEYDLGPKWLGFTEFILYNPFGQSNGSPRQNYFHFGIQHFFTPDLQLDLHTAFGLNQAADNLAFTGVGLSKRW